MSFLRPEVVAFLTTWRGVGAGFALTLLGVWVGMTTHGVLAMLGWVAMVLGGAQIVIAVQRKRFHNEFNGPGIVSIDEGQISYFGPLNGGVVALHDLRAVALDPTGKPMHWVLTPIQGEAVYIPVTAAGSDALFDAFAQIDGFSASRMLDVLDHPGQAMQIVWRKFPARQIR